MKRIVTAVLTALVAVGAVALTPTTASAAGNCTPYGSGPCLQRITVNTANQKSLKVRYQGQSGYYLLTRATTSSFVCMSHGLHQVYVSSGYNIRLKGYFGSGSDNRYKTIYFTTTGWHTLPANFIGPKCANRNTTIAKYGVIHDAYQYRQ